jgi:hypothetical protein
MRVPSKEQLEVEKSMLGFCGWHVPFSGLGLNGRFDTNSKTTCPALFLFNRRGMVMRAMTHKLPTLDYYVQSCGVH